MSEIPVPEEVANEANIPLENPPKPEQKIVTEIKNTEAKEALPKETDDPKEFMDRFRQTREYQDGLAERKVETRERNPDLDDERIEKAYLKSDKAKDAFHHLYQNDFKITYDSEKYSSEFKVALAGYFRMTRSNVTRERLMRFETRDDLLNAENQRMRLHDEAAEQLVVDGAMPNFRLARVYVHFLTVSEGLDSYSPERDEYRIKVRGR